MQKLELDIYPVGHVFYVARSFKKYNTIKTIYNGYEWEREEVTYEPQVRSKRIGNIDIELYKDKIGVTYRAQDVNESIHRIDTGERFPSFGLAKIYSPEEIGMFKDANEAWEFAKAKADAGEEYYGPK